MCKHSSAFKTNNALSWSWTGHGVIKTNTCCCLYPHSTLSNNYFIFHFFHVHLIWMSVKLLLNLKNSNLNVSPNRNICLFVSKLHPTKHKQQASFTYKICKILEQRWESRLMKIILETLCCIQHSEAWIDIFWTPRTKHNLIIFKLESILSEI